MKRLSLLTAILLATSAAYAKNYQVGNCLQGIQNFATVQAAVSGVPPSSTIFVCPGLYPGQVTISQPLTLRGVAFNNQDRPVIALTGASGGGFSTNANSLDGQQFVSVVLVQNVSPPGDVDIINLTVDGNGGDFIGCGLGVGGDGSTVNLAGIFYDSGTSGKVEASTVRNIYNPPGCGYAIWLQNGSSIAQSVEVANVVVHDFDNSGISAYSNQNPSSLTINILNNSVHGNRPSSSGISVHGVVGSIAHNVVTEENATASTAIFAGDNLPISTLATRVDISNNDIANAYFGIEMVEANTAKSNRISNTGYAFVLGLGANANPGPALFANTIKNTGVAVEYECTANVSLKSNTINDAHIAYNDVPPNLTINNAVNPLYNVDVMSAACGGN